MKKPTIQTSNPVPRSAVHNTPSIIGQDLQIDGNISGSSELQLEGTITGNLSCTSLVMGDNGSVKGDIQADNVTIRGRVDGQVTAKVVHLESSALINGDVFYESLTVESGAKLNGRFNHGTPSQTAAPTVTTPKEAAE